MKSKLLNNRNIRSFITFGLTGVLEALIIIILLKSLTKDSYGEWIFFSTIVMLLIMLLWGFIFDPLIKYLAELKSENKDKELIGSAWVLGLLTLCFILLINYSLYFIFYNFLKPSLFFLIFKWFPIFGVLSFPFYLSLALFQARHQYINIIVMRAVYYGPFLIFLILNLFLFKLPLEKIITVFIGTQGLASLVSLVFGWSRPKDILSANKKYLLQLFHFGKYGIGNALGTNLLKSSDTFVIGIVLSKPDLAVYSIPFKLIEFFNIPIESCAIVANNEMNKAYGENNKKRINDIFYNYTGFLFLLFIPIICIIFLFAKELIFLFAGKQYSDIPVCITLLRIFLVYVLLRVIDRFTGVFFYIIDKPRLNFQKIIFMTVFNVLGDIAVILLWRSLEAVAVVSILNTVIGLIIGLRYLRNEKIHIKIEKIFKNGIQSIKRIFKFGHL